MRRCVGLGTLLVFSFGAIQASPEAESRPQKTLAQHLFGVKGFALAVFSAAIQHIRVVPEEWGSNSVGFAKRFSSSFGHHLVKGTVQYGVAKAVREDLRYYPSEQPGFRPRLKHALISTVYARKTNRPGQTVAVARISGNVAGGFVSRLWQPASLRTVASGFSSTGISFAVDAGLNTVREFWPEIRHPRGHLSATSPHTETEIEVVEIGTDGCRECTRASESH